MTTTFAALVQKAPGPLAMPIAVHPGVVLTGARVKAIVTCPEAQANAVCALQRRTGAAVLLSAMDLSAEAEAFGCPVYMTEDEVPTVAGPCVTTRTAAGALGIPEVGAGRTWVYLDTVRRLRAAQPGALVLGGCIGPFSLASRLMGMTEALGLTLEDPGFIRAMLAKTTAFLADYIHAFRKAGADGVIMAEPGAGLLSPRGMMAFSSAWIREIVRATADGRFALILHNCAAKLVHLPAILESEAPVLHFGAPMDIVGALARVPGERIVCGNLDPTAIFLQGTPASVAERTQALLVATKGFRNFVASSGCDVPHGTPIENLAAFFDAVATRRELRAEDGRSTELSRRETGQRE